ncbi:MAG: hypothetical protein VX289_00875, partial [Candidatus Poribacteria bacterium]|nr:hypothetical protein [Candidatus Poribacteria bacterium]
GWPIIKTAETLLINPETVHHHFKYYKNQGINGLSKNGDGGSEPRLKQVQLEELEGPLDYNLYPCAKDVTYHVKKHFDISSSVA